MFKDIRSLTKHSMIYSVGNIATRLVGIILIPLYTRVIPVDMFGIYALFEVTIQFGQGLLLFGLPTAIFRWFSTEKIEQRRLIFSTAFHFSVFISFLLCLIFFFGRIELSNLFFHADSYATHFVLTALIIACLLPTQLLSAKLRFDNKSLHFISVKLVKFFTQLIVTIILVAKIKAGILGILWGHFISDVIVLIILIPYTLKNITLNFNHSFLIGMIRFGVPLSISGLSSRFLNMGDRYILGLLTDMKTVGIYAIGYKIANLVDTLIIQSFQNAFIPMAWKKVSTQNSKRFYAKTLTYLSFLLAWIALFLSVFRHEIIHLFTKNSDYWEASNIIGIVVLAVCIKGVATIVKMGLQFSKQTKYIALSVFTAALLNAGLNFLFIPKYSFYGAAYATLASFVFMMGFVLLLSQKYYPVQYEWKRIFLISISCFFLYITSLSVNHYQPVLKIILKLIMVLFYPLVLYVIRFFDKNEIYRLKGAWVKWRNPQNWKHNLKKIKL